MGVSRKSPLAFASCTNPLLYSYFPWLDVAITKNCRGWLLLPSRIQKPRMDRYARMGDDVSMQLKIK